MKKYFILLAIAAVAAVSCSKAKTEDIVGGRSQEYNWGGYSYMMCIADNLTTDALDELEQALLTEERNTSMSSHFEMSGSLLKEGSSWRVSTEATPLQNLKIEGKGDYTFQLTYEGNYSFGMGEAYPTHFSIEAKLLRNGEGAPGNWKLNIKGGRTERGGYRCTFETPQGIEYSNTLGSQSNGWNQIFGDLYMTVYKDNTTVDLSCLSFNGSPSQAKYTRGL